MSFFDLDPGEWRSGPSIGPFLTKSKLALPPAWQGLFMRQIVVVPTSWVIVVVRSRDLSAQTLDMPIAKPHVEPPVMPALLKPHHRRKPKRWGTRSIIRPYAQAFIQPLGSRDSVRQWPDPIIAEPNHVNRFLDLGF